MRRGKEDSKALLRSFRLHSLKLENGGGCYSRGCAIPLTRFVGNPQGANLRPAPKWGYVGIKIDWLDWAGTGESADAAGNTQSLKSL
jgi:hypothetical protein